MITIKLDDQSGNTLLQLYRLKETSAKAIRQAFYYIGKDLRQTSQQSILDKNKTGKTYLIRLGRIKKNHQSSAPGEAPANITGTLRKSIGFEIRGAEQLEFGSRDNNYAPFLELGTSKMSKRPFLISSINKNSGNAVQHFETEIEKEIGK